MKTGERFRELAQQLGGFNEDAMNAFFYANNPFALKHWTMNIIELLLIAGAVIGLIHAVSVLRQRRNPTHLSFWLASVVFMFAVEVPVYFPDLIGGDPNSILFIHNEFSLGFFYDRTPLYIMALYPALMYPSYVVVEQLGIFDRAGIFLGALVVGFVNHCFYEIFDQFGPQYGWWIWNYQGFSSTVASVPVSSIYSFAFAGPLALALLTRLLVAPYVARRRRMQRDVPGWQFAGLAILVGMLTPLTVGLLSVDTWYRIITHHKPDPAIAANIMFGILAIAGAFTLYQFLKAKPAPANAQTAGRFVAAYPLNFLVTYLLVFIGLWAFGMRDYLGATNGITARGTPIGSLTYVLGCFVLCGLFLCRTFVFTRRLGAAQQAR